MLVGKLINSLIQWKEKKIKKFRRQSMQDKDIKDEVLEEDINKEEVKEEAHEHEHEHKHGGHSCCGKHGHKHEEEIGKLKKNLNPYFKISLCKLELLFKKQ